MAGPELLVRKVGLVVSWIDMNRAPFRLWQGWLEPSPVPW